MKLFSMTEIAEAFNISVPSVHKWVMKGCPYVKKGQGGKAYQFNLPDVIVWHEKYLGKAEALKDFSFLEARAKREQFRALNEELDYKIKAGEFINADVAMQVWDRVAMACRSRLLALPGKVAPVIASLKSIPEIKDHIEKLIHEALNELSRIDPSDYAKDLAGSQEDEPAADAQNKRVGRPKKNIKPIA